MQQVPSVPANVEAEIALIGCILMDENLIVELSDILLPDDFYDSKNRLIYRTMLNLSKEGKNIDVTTVVSTLEGNHLLEQCGGIEYLSSIADRTYSTLNFESYCDLVSEASIKRTTIQKLTKLAQDGYDSKVEAFDYVDLVEKEVFELSKRRKVDSFKPISVVSKTVLTNTEQNSSRSDEVVGLDTGFGCLNKYTQGFQPGQLIILAARPAMGKSAMAMNLAVRVARTNKGGHGTVAIFSLEMSAEQLVERMIACDSNIRLNNIKSGRIGTKNDWTRFNTACNNLGQLNLYFDDSSDASISSIRAKCRKLASDVGLDFIVIDYLQLIESDSANSRATQQERVSKISRSLKLMARELSVPVLALSQLSREVEKRDDKKPIMADLRDSGSIEQDADIVMFLYREDYYNKSSTRKNEADLIISKNRSGSTNNGLPFMFTGEYSRFTEKKDE
ncbi:MAG: replicative DNA helicase [Roseburia sp.]|nr:replicative DNA helicase [Anaeroplasma bactoclasticum]MCM1196014.1 replicative DNA helicase [Roseburia sp.]MCM1557092.1 replicative DNA helicase [Anaeroplasma bactoclasticum]